MNPTKQLAFLNVLTPADSIFPQATPVDSKISPASARGVYDSLAFAFSLGCLFFPLEKWVIILVKTFPVLGAAHVCYSTVCVVFEAVAVTMMWGLGSFISWF